MESRAPLTAARGIGATRKAPAWRCDRRRRAGARPRRALPAARRARARRRGRSRAAGRAARARAAPTTSWPRCSGRRFAVRARHFGRRGQAVRAAATPAAASVPRTAATARSPRSSTSDIARYRLKPVTVLERAARTPAAASGARRYCMVTSARGPSARDIEHFAQRGDARSAPSCRELELCVSLGLMDDAQARAAARRRRRLREPQPQHEPSLLPGDLHDAHLRRPRGDGRERDARRPVGSAPA